MPTTQQNHVVKLQLSDPCLTMVDGDHYLGCQHHHRSFEAAPALISMHCQWNSCPPGLPSVEICEEGKIGISLPESCPELVQCVPKFNTMVF